MRSSRDDAAGDVESGGVPGAAPDGSGKFRSGSRTYGSVPPPGAEPASEERESTLGYIFRVSEPIVFWTACTLIAAFSCLGMIRITRFPHFPATLPEGHDGRTMQVGYVANSTGALESYVGCAPTRGGENLRDDIGTDRFPDFVIAGARGAPVDALHRLLREKHVACSAENVDDDLFGAPRHRAAPIPLDEQRRWVESNYHRCGEEERFLGVPRFQTSRDLLYRGWAPERMCEAMGSEETRAVILLPDPINHALAVFSEVLAPPQEQVRPVVPTRGGGALRGGGSLRDDDPLERERQRDVAVGRLRAAARRRSRRRDVQHPRLRDDRRGGPRRGGGVRPRRDVIRVGRRLRRKSRVVPRGGGGVGVDLVARVRRLPPGSGGARAQGVRARR